MDKRIPANCPAFPCGADVKKEDEGISMRDWFAGQALAGMMTDSIRTSNLNDVIGDDVEIAKTNANWAYTLADAMIAERSR